eukprot:GILJ01040209.1.p1 GENE.GILJ01040209.1~~GILJ01040209.1.p1  ORF type:complete len:175 (-),score=22.50 GILJ01040209.1:1-525(-)
MIYDAVYGKIFHAASLAFFTYYFIWIAVTPFIDTTHFSQRIFPPLEYGLLIPSLFLMLLATLVYSLVAYHLIMRTGMKEKEALIERRKVAKAATLLTPPQAAHGTGSSTPLSSREHSTGMLVGPVRYGEGAPSSGGGKRQHTSTFNSLGATGSSGDANTAPRENLFTLAARNGH